MAASSTWSNAICSEDPSSGTSCAKPALRPDPDGSTLQLSDNCITIWRTAAGAVLLTTSRLAVTLLLLLKVPEGAGRSPGGHGRVHQGGGHEGSDKRPKRRRERRLIISNLQPPNVEEGPGGQVVRHGGGWRTTWMRRRRPTTSGRIRRSRWLAGAFKIQQMQEEAHSADLLAMCKH